MNLLLVNDIIVEADTMKAKILWDTCGIENVFTAYSAADAKTLIKKGNIDLLLCDIEMPGENGLSLIHWVQGNHYDIDCILLTCHADFSYAREGLALGCQDYILLPAKYEDIARSVSKVCERRIQRQEEERLKAYGENWLRQHSEVNPETEPASHKTSAEITASCIEYILNNIDNEELSVNAIAASLYLNPIHLNRLFKKEKGVNLSQWIIRERMTLAAMLMRTTDLSVMNIALKAGYSNYPYFSTVFKKYHGCSPSQYVAANKMGETPN